MTYGDDEGDNKKVDQEKTRGYWQDEMSLAENAVIFPPRAIERVIRQLASRFHKFTVVCFISDANSVSVQRQLSWRQCKTTCKRCSMIIVVCSPFLTEMAELTLACRRCTTDLAPPTCQRLPSVPNALEMLRLVHAGRPVVFDGELHPSSPGSETLTML